MALLEGLTPESSVAFKIVIKMCLSYDPVIML